MKCWICGGDAGTGEHRAKKTDLAMVFKNVSQRTPLYEKSVLNGEEKIKEIGSLKSDKLKWQSKLCCECNNKKTQPFDMAWEKLSAHLQNNITNLNNRKKLKLQTVFPGTVEISMLNVHQYFLKVFGCIIQEHDVPIPIKKFSRSIMQNKAHPEVYIGFGYRRKVQKKNLIMLTPIESITTSGVVHFASWQYWVRNVFVDVIYSIDRKYMKVVREYWHPEKTQKILKLSELKNNQISIIPET
ncbi:MAG: hypothetical protein GXP14_15790 [Gammaproteobacteria bacterium]|nr:hypothetical protein [Gammaproteobacteria bacterium]